MPSDMQSFPYGPAGDIRQQLAPIATRKRPVAGGPCLRRQDQPELCESARKRLNLREHKGYREVGRNAGRGAGGIFEASEQTTRPLTCGEHPCNRPEVDAGRYPGRFHEPTSLGCADVHILQSQDGDRRIKECPPASRASMLTMHRVQIECVGMNFLRCCEG